MGVDLKHARENFLGKSRMLDKGDIFLPTRKQSTPIYPTTRTDEVLCRVRLEPAKNVTVM